MNTTNNLAATLATTRHLLLDFDGPVCSLFAHVDTAEVAHQLRAAAGDLHPPAHVARTSDPMDVLTHAALEGREISQRVEFALATAERSAITTAEPTTGASEVLATARKVGLRITIVSNNSERAIARYLQAQKLVDAVDDVVGRTPDNVQRLKPSPHLLIKALTRLRTKPEEAAFVGDSVSDMTAARAANVPGIGFSNKPGKRQGLTAAGAAAVVSSMEAIEHVLGPEEPFHPGR